jgi:hypothetical protein
MVCPIVCAPTISLGQKWGPKRCFYWGAPNVSFFFDDRPINVAPSKKKKKEEVMNAPMN